MIIRDQDSPYVRYTVRFLPTDTVRLMLCTGRTIPSHLVFFFCSHLLAFGDLDLHMIYVLQQIPDHINPSFFLAPISPTINIHPPLNQHFFLVPLGAEAGDTFSFNNFTLCTEQCRHKLTPAPIVLLSLLSLLRIP